MELDRHQQELMRKAATPSRLAQYTSKEIIGFQWKTAPHIDYMEHRVLDCVFDAKTRFISISMPPQHGKSTYCSLYLPAWYLGMFPEKNVILVSYNEDFAIKWGRGVRDILTMYGKELFGRTVSAKVASVTDWKMERSFGGMLSVGISGGVTGQPADLIVVDDLLKNSAEARSEATKKQHITEYDTSIRTRLHPGGTIVGVATRWAPDDLPGHWREEIEGGDHWDFADFPALAMCPDDADPETWQDELGRKEGDPLWPQGGYDRDFLLQTKASQADELTWWALWQQDPRLGSDSMFPEDRWVMYPAYKRDEIARECVRLVRAWDLAASQDSGDFTVGVLMGLHADGRIYILDVQRFREHSSTVEQRVLETAKRDGQQVKVILEEERAGSGKTVTAHYKKVLMAYHVEGIRAEGSKEERASIYSSKQGDGLVLLPDRAPWLKDFIYEHKNFGHIRHDDQVDTAAYAFNDLSLGGPGALIFSPQGLNFDALEQLQALLERA